LLVGMVTMFLAISIFLPPLTTPEMLLGPRAITSVALGTYLHLLLDAFTESGVYLAYPFSRKRVAIAHLEYDNPWANGLAIAGSLTILLLTIWNRYGYLVHEVVRAWFAK